ncbi:MAG TPA: hypothetical protein VG166_00500 [Caulobacteraceae bacterium]|jgi:MFS superfamily sulfate permease-like transporter|nr:hypothetical protein [Caulobacteraceae bacterium]
MNLPDLRTLTPPQVLLGVLTLAVLVGLAVSARRRPSSDSGVGVAVWVMVPLILVVGALAAWVLIGMLRLMGSGFVRLTP